jgi:hypothetical protein
MRVHASFRKEFAGRLPDKPVTRHARLILEPLENRILFSAAPLASSVQSAVTALVAPGGSSDEPQFQSAGAGDVAMSSDASLGDITLYRSGSAVQVFVPATDTDIDRGMALRTALAEAQPGDELLLGAATYDMGGDAHVELADGITVTGAGKESTKITSSCPQSVDGSATFTLHDGTVVQDCWLEGSLQNGLYQPLVGIQGDPGGNVTAILRSDKITGDSDGIFLWTGNTYQVTIDAYDCDISTNYDAVAVLGSSLNKQDVELFNCSITVAQPDPTEHHICNCVNLQSGTVELNNCTLTATGDADSIQTFGVWTWNQGSATIVDSTFHVSGTSGLVYDLYNTQSSPSCTVVGGQGSGPNGTYIASSATTTPTTVVARNIFYNNSSDDGNDPAANASDDAAIASDKSAYIPDGTAATIGNITSYDKGINGVMIDLAGIHGDITANDFNFNVGNDNSPSSWSPAPAPVSITVRRGEGILGSDRIELIWADDAIQDEWLEVTVTATSATGLAADSVFFYGNDTADALQPIAVALYQPPVLNLNGSVSPNFTAFWNVGGGPANIACTANSPAGATLTDPSSGSLTSLSVVLASPQPGDLLTATGTENISVSAFDGSSLVLSGADSLANYKQVLRTIRYDNTAAGPGGSAVTATVTATDGNGLSASANVVIEISDFSTQPVASTVTGRNLFYAGSGRFDVSGGPRGPLAFSDDNAIATDKSAYLPGSGAATFANVSSYDRGINGIMVDLLGSGSHTSITQANILDDFTFKVGNNNLPSTWTAAPNPLAVTVRTEMNPANNGPGAVGGADRIELVWADGAITEQWLEVIVQATANTGLAANDVFFFGNSVGDSGLGDTATLSETNSVDELGARNNSKNLLFNIPVTNLFDYNRDGLVNSVDQLVARNNTQTLGATRYINIDASEPLAPQPPGDAGSGMASALATAATNPSTPSVTAWIAERISQLDLNYDPIASDLVSLALANTPEAKLILVTPDQVADSLGLDDELLDSLLVELEYPAQSVTRYPDMPAANASVARHTLLAQ